MKPPYKIIADNLSRGSVIPFLGAGASQSARGKEKWTAGCGFFPLGRELALHLAEHANFPMGEPRHARENLAYVASFYANIQTNRADLNLLLRSIFTDRVAPGRLHERLAANEKPLLIITTNYDDLLEQAFEQLNKPYHLIITKDQKIFYREPGKPDLEEQEARKLDVFTENSEHSIIYKMHGSIDRRAASLDSFIITEEDYINLLADMSPFPSCFFGAMRARDARFLFLGYGLQDWNFRVMLRKLRDSSKDNSMSRSWAFQYQISPVEKELWKCQLVNNYELKKLGLTFDSFADLL